MINKIAVSFVLILMVAPAFGKTVNPKNNRKDVFELMSNESKENLIKMFVEEYPFTGSKEYKNYPETLNVFFTEPIYKKLQGNFMRGYQYNEGFDFKGREIALVALKSVSEGRPYLQKFVQTVNKVFVGNGMKFVDKEKTPYEIGFCIVSVMPKLTEMTFPGVFLEVLMTNKKTGRSLFYRFGQGSKQGIDKAMMDSCAMVLATLFTHATDREPPKEN